MHYLTMTRKGRNMSYIVVIDIIVVIEHNDKYVL
jgi:hypothetical protein